MAFKKYLPYLFAFVAIAGLYMQYEMYRKSKKGCACSDVDYNHEIRGGYEPLGA